MGKRGFVWLKILDCSHRGIMADWYTGYRFAGILERCRPTFTRGLVFHVKRHAE